MFNLVLSVIAFHTLSTVLLLAGCGIGACAVTLRRVSRKSHHHAPVARPAEHMPMAAAERVTDRSATDLDLAEAA